MAAGGEDDAMAAMGTGGRQKKSTMAQNGHLHLSRQKRLLRVKIIDFAPMEHCRSLSRPQGAPTNGVSSAVLPPLALFFGRRVSISVGFRAGQISQFLTQGPKTTILLCLKGLLQGRRTGLVFPRSRPGPLA